MRREPAVAGKFYPGEATALRQTLSKLIPDNAAPQKALAVISPHAGFVYSGAVAGETFAAVEIPRDIVILGPNHHGYGAPVALMAEGTWETPLGEVPINRALAESLASGSAMVNKDELAHRFEHSLEVQIPFLQHLRADLTLTPLVISRLPLSACQELGEELASAIAGYGKPVLMVASTDMTHYESREAASRKDHLAMEHIKALDPAGLYHTVLGNKISMCGIMPTTVTLFAALRLGASKVELIRYSDSGQVNGDTSQVVGYAGLVIS